MPKLRTWFFNQPTSTSGKRFVTNNRPNQYCFSELVNSTAFKLEADDTASEAGQGLVKLCTDVNAKIRTSAASGMQTVVRPHQIPSIEYLDGTEPTVAVPGTPNAGLSITAQDTTVTGGKRLNFRVSFDPYYLTAKGTPVAADSIPIVDSEASNVPKKITITSLMALVAGAYWTNAGSELYPAVADPVKFLGNTYFNFGADRYFYIKQHDSSHGDDLHIRGGHSHNVGTLTGGHLWLYGGTGNGGGVKGNTYVAYNSSSVGYVGIRGTAGSTGYETKVTGGLEVTALFKYGTSTPDASTQFVVTDANGVAKLTTPRLAMDLILATTMGATKAITVYDGAGQWGKLDIGASDKYLRVTAGNAFEFGDLVLTGKIVDADVSGTNIFSWTRMATLTPSRAMVTNGSGVASVSAVTSTQIGYLSTLASDPQVQITNALEKSQGNGALYKTSSFSVDSENASWYIMDITSASVQAELPALSSVETGATYKFTKKFSAGAFAATVVPKAASGDAIYGPTHVGAATLTIGGVTMGSISLVKVSATHWELVETIVTV
ncbi:MAG: hypothetical protein H8E51_06990 [Bacteroidetes bacterium]|nr:hypothetical protein [Bacteroidota bacterium]